MNIPPHYDDPMEERSCKLRCMIFEMLIKEGLTDKDIHHFLNKSFHGILDGNTYYASLKVIRQRLKKEK